MFGKPHSCKWYLNWPQSLVISRVRTMNYLLTHSITYIGIYCNRINCICLGQLVVYNIRVFQHDKNIRQLLNDFTISLITQNSEWKDGVWMVIPFITDTFKRVRWLVANRKTRPCQINGNTILYSKNSLCLVFGFKVPSLHVGCWIK